MFSALAILLVAVLVWVVARQFGPKPRTHFAALTIQQYTDVAVPPLALSKADGDYVGEALGNSTSRWNDLRDSDHIDVLERLKKLELKQDDVLVLYVRTHGVSDYDQPPPKPDATEEFQSESSAWADAPDKRSAFLLCGNFVAGTDEGRYPLSELLDVMTSCQASVKLLLLDPGSIGTDPRFGMMINEFSRVIEKDVKATADPELWVLLPNGVLQTGSRGLPARSRSPFAEALGDAFADLDNTAVVDGNKAIALSELCRYLLERSQGWSEGGVPLVLINGARGRIDDPTRIKHDVFIFLPPDVDESEEDEEEDVAEASKRPEVQYRGKSSRLAGRNRHVGLPRGESRPTWFSQRIGVNSAAAVALFQKAAGEKPSAVEAGAKSDDGPSDAVEKPSDGAAAPPAPTPKRDGESRPDSSAAVSTKTDGSGKETVAKKGASDEVSLDDMNMAEMVERAWSVRDELQHHINGPGINAESRAKRWSPVDFAPHLWRLLNARLLSYERDSIFGNTSREKNLRALIANLETLKGAVDNGPGDVPFTGLEDVGEGLLTSWSRLHSEQPRVVQSWKVVTSENPLKGALRLSADLSFLAPYYVAWYDAASLTSPSAGNLNDAFEDIEGLLDQLDRFDAALRRATSGGSEKIDESEELIEAYEELLKRHTSITKLLDRSVEKALRDAGKLGGQHLALDLLSTPLLPESRRSELRKKVLAKDFKMPGKADIDDLRSSQPSAEQWEQARRRAALHGKLVRLFSPSSAKKITTAVSKLQGTGDANLKIHAKIGRHVRAAYDQMLGQLLAGGGTALALARVDARDVPRLTTAESSGIKRTFRPLDLIRKCPIKPPATTLQLTRRTPTGDPLPLSLSLQELSVQLVMTDHPMGNDQDVTFVFEHGDQLELFSPSDDKTPIKTLKISNGLKNGTGTLRLLIRAKDDRHQGDGKVVFTISATVKGIRGTNKMVINCELPQPDRVDVVLRRVGADKDVVSSSDPQKITLKPFPNRVTSYDLSLINRSGKPRRVKVELVAAKRPAKANWPPGRMFYAGNETILEQVKEANSKRNRPIHTWELNLPAGSDPIKLKSTAQKPDPDGKKPAPDDANKPTESEGDPKPKTRRVTDGLICVITDIDTTDATGKTTNYGKTWSSWIEFKPREPRDYLNVVAEFDKSPQGGERGRVVVTITPKDGSLPYKDPKSEQKSINIRWFAQDEFDTPKLVPSALGIDLPEPGNESPENKKWRSYAPVKLGKNRPDHRYVWLSVDDYPRAFVLKVAVDSSDRKTEDMLKEGGLAQVRIASLQGPKRERVYVPLAGNALACCEQPQGDQQEKSDPKATGDQKVEQFKQTKNLPIVFNMADLDDPNGKLEVQLQVDVARRDFQTPGEQSIEVKLASEFGGKKVLFAARQVEIGLRIPSPDGRLSFETTVSDHTVRLAPAAEGRASVEARLRGINLLDSDGRSRGVQTKHDVPVVFDSDQPKILALQKRNPARAGRTLKWSVDVSDTSGLIRVMHAFKADELKWIESELIDTKIVDAKNRKWKDVKGNKQVDFDVTIPKDFEEGSRVTLLIKVVDYVGREARAVEQKLTVPAKEPPPVTLVKKGTIKGYIVIGDGDTPIKGNGFMKVTLTGGAERSEKIDAKGYFSFEDVPPGKYTVTFSGTIKGYDHFGLRENVEPSDSPIRLKAARKK
ncbi:MAG: carboxypeptidase regulatory-like domain-containing protein [Planctomycetes bacterium]|nr:carboxypeptidase regulatory-like domain-containing protein [Planctomycetota bacterium]